MMSHHRKSPSNRSSNNDRRLHQTSAAAEEEPTTMFHSHSGNDRMRLPVVHLQPNLIARLMGIDDAAVVPTPPAAQVQVQVQARRQPYSLYRGGDDDPDYCSSGGSSSRIICLQKMRQDLRAWQASKAPPAMVQKETSSCGGRPSSDHSHDGGGGRSSSLALQGIAQEDLRRQKMARYGLAFGLGHTSQSHTTNKVTLRKRNGIGSVVARGECDPSSSEHHEDAAAQPEPEPAATAMPMPDDSVVVISPSTTSPRAAATDARAQELPSPIVLLKPATRSEISDTTTATGGVAAIGGGGGGGGQKTETVLIGGLPKLPRDAGMSVLLQEVKDRVQRELTLLTAGATATRGETPVSVSSWAAIPRPSQQQQLTKEDRHGNKRRLFRSESFRAFRRDRRRNASPEEAAYYIPKSGTAVSPEKPGDEKSVTDSPLSAVLRPGVGVSDGQSFRSECLTTKHRDEDDASPSPRLLFRSLSAPEPGSSLGSRLFGDAIIDSRARSTKRGASEPAADAMTMTTTTKNVVSAGFSSFVRGTVSSLRHGFSSRRNPLPLFRRKTHWSSKASLAEIHPAMMEMPACAGAATTPPSSHQTTLSLFKVAQANLSELPPSPVSPLEVAAGHSSRQFFTDLHFTLPPAEVSPKCVSELEPPVGTSTESSFRTDISAVEAARSRDKAYITELLIAAGLHYDDGDGSSSSSSDNKASASRVDSMARPMPICDDVFEDVEDMYYYRGDYLVSGGGISMCDGTDHRMLFDLANEALQRLVVESSNSKAAGSSSSLRQWVVDSSGVAPGKKLVDDVWQQVQALRNTTPQAQEMQTIDGMVAYEVRRCVWTEVLLYEDVYVVGRKIERAIFDELIQDFLACAGGFELLI